MSWFIEKAEICNLADDDILFASAINLREATRDPGAKFGLGRLKTIFSHEFFT